MNNLKVIILAAGKGVRMESDLPKVLMKVKGKSMINHLTESVKASGVDKKPVIVVGYKKELVMTELGGSYEYVTQEEQLGTGHAVLCTKKTLENKAENIMVLYGDSPYLHATTIKKLADEHLESKNKITMLTVEVPDFEEWRSFFYKSFSRIVRDNSGKILKSVEFKDATDEEKNIKEVNPCYFCFNASWLWEKLNKLENHNMQKEYYLTDLIKMAIEEGETIESIKIDPSEALAANSKAELEILEKFVV
ncbi:NTP transferase domain-containing protein [Candidatus Nomurabacteria bacterium]|nr:NTP transferase domain-containing protein [Candidatus Nomurabacteria bacterium]